MATEAELLLQQLRAQKAQTPAQKMLAELRAKKAAEPPQPPDRGFGNELVRQAGLTGRAAVQGVTALPAMAAEPVRMVMNKALQIAGSDFRFPNQSEAVSQALTDIGAPSPETPTERVVGNAAELLSSGAGLMGVGKALVGIGGDVAPAVGNILQSGPKLQAASAITGGASSGAAKESGVGPAGQAIAGLVGGIAPSALEATGASLVRGLARGSNPATMQETISDFAKSGTTPSIGQATGRRGARAIESVLSKTPGGAGVFADKAKGMAGDISSRVESIADNLVPKATATRAGLAIERGVKGPSGLIDRFKTTAGRLYDAVDDGLDTSANIPINSTRAHLQKVNTAVPDAPATADLLKNKFLNNISKALESDVAETGSLPYASVKAVRSMVGEKLGNLSLVSDVSKGQLKQLYGALSEDLTAAAKVAGPKAFAAAKRADNFYKSGISRIENVERVVNKNGGGEKIFQAALAGTKEGATTLRTVMKSIPDKSRKLVTAAVVRRMGKATPGQQDATSEAFSISTYLTNWSKLSPEAKGALFGRIGPKFNKNMNALAKVAGNIREGSQVFSNPSGTQAAISLQTTTGGAALAAVLGNVGLASSIVGGVGAANIIARAMVNPRIVKFLAQTTKAPQGTIPALINNLGGVAKRSNDEDAARFFALLKTDTNEDK